MSAESFKIPKTKLSRIPGVPNIPTDKNINVRELKKYTKVELEELLERQQKLLSNK